MDERILVVDDEKDICEILGFNLSNEGYRVDTATSAEEALRKLTPEHALILLDVMMGGMSGYKMAEKLRHDGNRIPIIFLTAKDTENDMLTGFSVGGDDYIPKPFSIKEVEARGIAFYGGPDMAAPDFSPLQKAVSYSMTSVFTTGGIRGNRRSIGKFSPRSFNLGISRPLFEQVGGFSDMRIGEDIDFSMRVMAAGAQAWFLPDAKVCHKRRTSIRLFFKQVFVFGTARVNLDIRHPESRRALFMLPSLFTIGSAALLLAALCTSPWFLLAVVGVAALWALGTPVQWGGLLLVLFGAVYAPWWFSLPFGALMLLWFADASVRNRSVAIGWLAVWTSFIQLYGYGAGYLYGLWLRRVLRKDEPYTYRVTKFFSQKTR